MNLGHITKEYLPETFIITKSTSKYACMFKKTDRTFTSGIIRPTAN